MPRNQAGKPPPHNSTFTFSNRSVVINRRVAAGASAGAAGRLGFAAANAAKPVIRTVKARLERATQRNRHFRMNATTITDERKRNKRVYEGVLEAVRHNSGLFHTTPGVAHLNLIANRARANVSPERTKKAIRAALDNGDLFRYEDRDGTTRYALATPKRLRAIIASENDRDDPDVELIERVVEAIGEVEV